MGILNTVAYKMRYGDDFASGATTPVRMVNRGGLQGPANEQSMFAYGDTVPADTTIGYSKGCIFQKYDGTLGTLLYINTGSYTSSAFVALDALIGANNLTIATAKTLAVTDADKLTVGGKIIPQYVPITFRVSLHASTVIYNIFNADRAYTVLSMSYTTNVAQAITATLVKSTVNATPASATTPLHIAGAIDANTTVHNGTIITPTVTGGDLVLAATNKIGLVLSGALTTGDFTVNLMLKFS